MGLRHTVGSRLEAVIGRDRTNGLRRAERTARNALARRLAMPTAKGAAPPAPKPAPKPAPQPAAQQPAKPAHPPNRAPSDPFVPHPRPPMTRHQMMRQLHEQLRPRTYFEVGIADGASMTLSRSRSIGVDPGFKVVRQIACDVQLVRATSDDFFAREEPMAYLRGVPIDLAFVDGLHLSEFALRDYFNTEPFMDPAGVIVLDDVLPRNGLEAARDRTTKAWAGDVYKAVEVLLRRRADLIVLLVNTAPTGTAIVCRLDPQSRVLAESYPDEEAYLTRPDPQDPPMGFMDRSIAVDPEVLLASPVWARLAELRESGQPVGDDVWQQLRELPQLGATPQPGSADHDPVSA